MIIDGEKWACDSCVKGHRVSNCNHADRPLNHIAPKGRPVKQCEHCRDARKSKSHHAKCDCGSKRTKDKKQNEAKSEDHGCSCHKGTTCVCSNKAELHDLRLENSLHRPTPAVKSKPKLTSSNSETTITVFANGHHKPVHRNNNLAHTSGAPYKIPRPHTLHGASAFAQAAGGNTSDNVFGRSVDDLLLLNSSNSNKLYGSLINAQTSAENLQGPNATRDVTSFDFAKLLVNTSGSSENASSEELATTAEAGMGWYESALTSVAEAPGDFTTSPNFMAEVDWNIPSATTDFFSPSDLPLVSNPAFPEYAQPISHSGESNYQSAPGLTAPSSGTQSETGDAAFPVDPESTTSLWTEDIAFRDASPYRMNSAPIYDNFSFNPPNVNDAKPIQSNNNNNNLFAFEPASSQQETPDANAGVNVGHLQNLASLQQTPSQSLAEKNSNGIDFANESTERSIIIPAGVDDDANDSWYFPVNADVTSSEQSREYSWLLDSV